MSSYNQEFNKDNTILRYIIVSLLAELKDKTYFYNRIDEDTLSKVNIPFYYSVTGGERFLTDNFLYKPIDEGYAIGDYEVVPRGVIQLDSVSIDSVAFNISKLFEQITVTLNPKSRGRYAVSKL